MLPSPDRTSGSAVKDRVAGFFQCRESLDGVLFLFLFSGMWTKIHDLRLTVLMGLRKGLGWSAGCDVRCPKMSSTRSLMRLSSTLSSAIGSR
jgi:hypothetical protein